MGCPQCRRAAKVEIGMEVQGATVTLHSCLECDVHWWDNDGTEMSLSDVLGMAKV